MLKAFLGFVALMAMATTAGCATEVASTEPADEGAAAATEQPLRDPASEDGFIPVLKHRGEIRIGIKYDVPRFGYLNPETGSPEGFEVDLGKAIAARLHVKATFLEAKAANRIPFLQNDTADLVISTMTITPARWELIDFSKVYFVAQQRIMVPVGSPIGEVRDLNLLGASVCSVTSSTSEKNLRIAAPNAQLFLQPTYSGCFAMLQAGGVQSVSTDDVVLLSLLMQDPVNYKITGAPFAVEPYGMGIKKGHDDFRDFVDGFLTSAKHNGTWVGLYDKWVAPLTHESAMPPADDVVVQGPTGPAL